MNNNLLLILCLLLSSIFYTESQSNGGHCQTPDNRNGICVRLRNCDNLFVLNQKSPLSLEERNFLSRSVCGNQRSHVCCLYRQVISEPRISVLTPSPRRTITTTTTVPTTTPRTSITTPKIGRSEALHAPIRISAKKCQQYAEYAYNKTYIVAMTAGRMTVNTSNCARNQESLVFEGEVARVREFPHMALIGHFLDGQTVWGCGGTLISELFVLSAAHCNETKFGPAKYVRLGEHDLSTTHDVRHIDFDIAARFLHNNVGWNIYNDIMLFKLNREVAFNHAIRPACLPERLDVPNELIASGWGATQLKSSGSDVLLKVTLEKFAENERFNSEIGRELSRYKSETLVFAGHHTTSKDTCTGDSGGPLQGYHQTHYCTYTVFGVVSRGRSCGLAASPGAYTRVYSHLEWIEQTIWPNE